MNENKTKSTLASPNSPCGSFGDYPIHIELLKDGEWRLSAVREDSPAGIRDAFLRRDDLRLLKDFDDARVIRQRFEVIENAE